MWRCWSWPGVAGQVAGTAWGAGRGLRWLAAAAQGCTLRTGIETEVAGAWATRGLAEEAQKLAGLE